LSIFFWSARLQFLLRNILSHRFAPYFLFSRKDLIKYLSSLFSAKSHHWRIGINWRHNYVINSKEYVTNRWTILNIYNQYSFSYKCWNFCANWLIWLEVIKENKGDVFSEHSVVQWFFFWWYVPARRIGSFSHVAGTDAEMRKSFNLKKTLYHSSTVAQTASLSAKE